MQLTSVFLNDAADPSDFAKFDQTGEAISLNSTPRVEVRQLINRRRLVRTGNKVYESGSLSLEQCTPDQVTWLRAHVGQLVCVRDHYGTKIFGAYSDFPRDISTFPRIIGGVVVYVADVKLSFDEISHSEAV